MNNNVTKKFTLRTGTDDFKELISSDGVVVDPNYLFVDKTLFLKDFLENGAKVLLITRPRRWGKSLAVSMLRYFLEKEVDGKPTVGLFQNLKIAEHIIPGSVLEKYQGKYPVITISFKDIKGGTQEEVELEIKEKIKGLFKSFEFLENELHEKNVTFGLASTCQSDAEAFLKIKNKRADFSEVTKSILFLSELLFKFYGQKVFILIDEYDNPINSNYDKPELCQWLTNFFGALFGACLKSNPYLEKGLVTGVLRIAKAEIFSGLNNLGERNILSEGFAEHYGFTEEETFDLIKKTDLEHVNLEEVRRWYNGYTVGDYRMYNPWSITQFIENKGNLKAYWVNTAGTKMLQKVFIDNAKSTDKVKVGQLLRKVEVTLKDNISESISMDDIFYSSDAVWSLMLHTGYLTICEKNNFKKIRFPNYEVRQLIEEFIRIWFTKKPVFSNAANALLFGNLEYFFEAMNDALKDPAYSARIFNNKSSSAPSNAELKEFMYQFLVMTELRCINTGTRDFEVIAEPELVSFGKTSPDFIVLNHPVKLCVVGEIKTLLRNETLEVAAARALAQIHQNNYGQKYQEEGYKLLKLGISFAGTDIEMVWEE